MQTRKLFRLTALNNLLKCCRSYAQASSGNKQKWSYAHGPSDTPLLGSTIGQALQDWTELRPDKEAAVFCKGNIRKTFQQILEESDQLAAGLLELGIKRGDRVGIWGPNSIEWILTQYATARAGIILVNINPMYIANEMQYVLEQTGCKAIIAAEEFKGHDYYDILFHLIPELARCEDGFIKSHRLPELETVIMIGEKKHQGTLKFSSVLEAGTSKRKAEIMDLQKRLQFDDPINIQFTSGTTGSPKGATLSHHNILNNSYFIGRRLGYHEKETRICIPVPLYHCFGMVIGSLTMASHGATCVFPSPAFDAKDTLEAISKERCTSVYGVPTMFIDMLNHPDLHKYKLSSLYTGIMAGAPCPIETMREVIGIMEMPGVTVCYGTTENSPVTFQNFRDDNIEKKIGTIGKPHPHVEAKVTDEYGNVVPCGTPGELCTRGYTTMLGYWNNPARTADVIKPDRWYRTGDIATMDEDGYCSVVGRITDMIIRGGENVYAFEIEQVIYHHPCVKDVQVVGVPVERLGEEIYAFIEFKEGFTCTEENIKDYCKTRMARFKVPRYVKFVKEFPLTATGKVQKFKLKDEAMRDLNLID
ncbi:medium-chain acyl-CoA ligase ACSF2, mitochondrial-like [Mytilus californianus]|uniref:medium-chain acyl-CoA ligase ACSF2, mitochondrial-like n=1 Tax=Mytilus californianus TaxID=6549 RepID=UPI0022450716|nr:medium-chain acyl-CoA ligase ACSF2, mitochondrial-like [Mytilus californianus]